MDAFEQVIAAILQRRGYWTMLNVKVDLTKAEKREIGRHSTPRWELDVLGYKGPTNELLVMECKSFLDSPGVRCATFEGLNPDDSKRYKLFLDDTLRKVVFQRLSVQLQTAGLCGPDPRVTLGLAAGKIKGDPVWLASFFQKRGWQLFGPKEIREELLRLRDSGYENSVAAVVAKMLLRESATPDAV